MEQHEQLGELDRDADGSWSVRAHGRRLVFCNGGSVVEVPVESPLRWSVDGEDTTFEQALATVPEELHGWVALAALIALRRCLAGLVTGAALPPGYQSWVGLARRAEPLDGWMEALGRLDGVDLPPMPGLIDDGLDDDDALAAGDGRAG
jgi:hypothetical protein